MNEQRSIATLRTQLDGLAAQARADIAQWSHDLEALPMTEYARVMPEACRILSQLTATIEGCTLLSNQAVTVPGADAVGIAYAAGARVNLRRIQARRRDLFPAVVQVEASYS